MESDIKKIMDVCLLAGKIMLSSGAETYRVEDTMVRIARSRQIQNVYSFVTPTGIFLSIQGQSKEEEQTKFIRIFDRSIDLNKVVLVNDISRKVNQNQIDMDEAYLKLQEIDHAKPLYPKWIQILAAAVASGFFSLMFGGNWEDFIPTFLTGGLGFILFILVHRLAQVKFFAEIVSSFFIGLFAHWLLYIGFGTHLDKIIVGSVMPLVPGLLITNAVRDLMAGDLVSGLARGAEAFITAFAIGTGIAVVIALI